MKRFFLFLFVAVLAVGCATTYYDSEGNAVPRKQVEQLRTAAVKAHLGERRYRVFVERVFGRPVPPLYRQGIPDALWIGWGHASFGAAHEL